YLGCYSEPAFPARALSYRVSGTSMDDDTCLDICRKQRYEFAGLEWSQECWRDCWCGNTLSGATQTNASQCDASCSVGDSLTCGGTRSIKFYTFVDASGASSAFSAA
ncbi:hypothetical protein GQ53DRAFT_622093, partial [Thozetella sp. PMI_491]